MSAKGKLAVGAASAVAGGHHGVRRILAGLLVLALVAALAVGGIVYLASHLPKSTGSTLPCPAVSVLFGDPSTPPPVQAAVAQALSTTGRTVHPATVTADLTIEWSPDATGIVTVDHGSLGGSVVISADSTVPTALTQLTADLTSPTVAPSCGQQAPSSPGSPATASRQRSSGQTPTTALLVVLVLIAVWWSAGPLIVRRVARLLRRGDEPNGDEENEPSVPDEPVDDEPVRWPSQAEFDNNEEALR